MPPHILDPFQGISPNLTDGVVWKAFGSVFNDMNLTFTVLSVEPLTIAAFGDASFALYAAGIASDRYPDQAKLLVVRMIQACIARYTDARFRLRFGREPALGDSSRGDPTSSLSGIVSAVQAVVRNDLANAFAAPAAMDPADFFAGLPDAVPPPTDAMLQKAIKYVFGEGQMRWAIVWTENGASIEPCYKFRKARSDAEAAHPADRARAAVVRVVDELIKSDRQEIVASIYSGTLTKEILRSHALRLLEEDSFTFRFFHEGGLNEQLFDDDETDCNDDETSLADMIAQSRRNTQARRAVIV